MRRRWAEHAHTAEVRDAARSWREAGAINAPTLAAIEAAHPDPRPALSPAWKVLIFFLVTVAVYSVSFGAVELFHLKNVQPVFLGLLFGALLAASTEVLRGSRFAGNGSDAAASFWAIVFLLEGFALQVLREPNRDYERMLTFLPLAAALLFGAACVHWGYSAYGVLAAMALFGLLGRFPAGRLAWILVAGFLIAATFRRLDRAALTPPHRRALAGVFAVSALSLYAAVNRYSVDQRLVESLQEVSQSGTAPSAIIRILSSVATALLPVVFLAWGIRARRTLVLDLGLVFTALSLVTLRQYVYLGPLWALLSAAGAALILGALWLNRYLRMRGGERRGFTAAPIFGGKRGHTLQAAAFVAGFANAPSPAGADRGDLSTGGGRFGGGGATGDF
jgi:hypothetical protein